MTYKQQLSKISRLRKKEMDYRAKSLEARQEWVEAARKREKVPARHIARELGISEAAFWAAVKE